jgi:hypothetical protein
MKQVKSKINYSNVLNIGKEQHNMWRIGGKNQGTSYWHIG